MAATQSGLRPCVTKGAPNPVHAVATHRPPSQVTDHAFVSRFRSGRNLGVIVYRVQSMFFGQNARFVSRRDPSLVPIPRIKILVFPSTTRFFVGRSQETITPRLPTHKPEEPFFIALDDKRHLLQTGWLPIATQQVIGGLQRLALRSGPTPAGYSTFAR